MAAPGFDFDVFARSAARALRAHAQGGRARLRVFHRANPQRTHAPGLLGGAAPFRSVVRARGLRELAQVKPFHVAAFIKELQRPKAPADQPLSPPTVKQNLAALRSLFDWLVTGHILEVNPAHAVRGPRHVVRKGKTPYLTSEEARALLDSIDTSTLVGLRDRALIATMTFNRASWRCKKARTNRSRNSPK